jgi:hypothetical protein
MTQIKRFTTIIIHLAGWLLFMTFPVLFMQGPPGVEGILPLLQSPHYWQFCLCYFILFYLNTEVLFPYLILKKKYFGYALALVLLAVGVLWIKPFDKLLADHPGEQHRIPIIPQPKRFHSFSANEGFAHRSPLPPSGKPRHDNRKVVDITGFFIFLIVLALSTATRTAQQWQQSLRRAAQAEAEKSQLELAFLKAQINPHFLFNTLNNIYTLAVMQSEKTAESILRISTILRYVIDDATQDYVSLAAEITCIRDYIQLQSLRVNKYTHVHFTVTGPVDSYQIAPLILLTFIENAFKYGVSNHQPVDITIRITIEDHVLSFFCQNALLDKEDRIERSGIGLTNIQRRLSYLYPDKHTLAIQAGQDTYTVTLRLQLE